MIYGLKDRLRPISPRIQ